jgi:predicted nucleotidyltransferase
MAVQPIIDQRSVIDEALIREVADRIVAAFHPKRIILFGSQARDDAHPDSDMDLFIEMETDLEFYSRIPPITKLFRFRRWSMDVFVYTTEEVLRDRGRNGTLEEMVEREGRVLYERR